jgi:hypothetical protein
MHQSMSAGTATVTLRVAALAMVVSVANLAAQDWVVPEAEVRITLKLEKKPTHKSAGYFVRLPDGGALPGPHPVTTVIPRGGKGRKGKKAGGAGEAVPSYTMWHGRQAGLYIVFGDPGGAGEVDVYVAGSQKPNPWNPATGLTPSAILCTDPSEGTARAAKNLARFGSIGGTVHARDHYGVKRAPFSIGGDLSGRPMPGSFYLLAYLNVTDPGKTWIAPFNLAGETEVRVNGDKLTPRERIDKWGGTGQYFNLGKGLQRVEVFQSAPGTGSYSDHAKKGGLMYLTWRRPNATMAELGGVRSKKVPMSGTSRMETRIINANEIAHSGSCSLVAAVSKGGLAAACPRVRATQVLWFGNEGPLMVYELEALTAGHPSGTTYQWELPGGGLVKGAKTSWLFPGLRENAAKLTVKSGDKVSQSVHSFFGSASIRTDLGKPGPREDFRQAMTNMATSTPSNPDSFENLPVSYWNNLIRTAELGKGFELLKNLFTERLRTTEARLTPNQVAILQDIYLDTLQRRDAKAAIAVIDKFQASMSDRRRRDAMLIRKAEVLMFQLDDVESATRGLAKFIEQEGELADWARIRLGDIAFINGDLNKATEFYSKVQSAARMRRNKIGGLVTEGLIDKNAAPPPKEEKETRSGNPRPVGTPDEKQPLGHIRETELAEVLPYRGSNWKVGALRDVSNSENVQQLIEEGYLLEAREALRAWEREFPLSKISGDLLMMEARYHMAIGDHRRAKLMLEAYCKLIDASSFLPEALRQLMDCCKELKTPRSEVKELFEKSKKRLEYHPVAKEIDEFLSAKE